MTARIRLSIRKRAELFHDHNGICGICHGKISVGEAWDADHEIPLEMGGADDVTNMRPVHVKCHRMKTRGDVAAIAKSNRVRARHMGIRRSPKFRGHRKFDGTIVWNPR